MFDFHKPSVKDIKWLKSVFNDIQPMNCGCTVGNILGWNDYYDESITCVDGCLVSRIGDKNIFLFPKGKNPSGALKLIVDNFDRPSFFELSSSECDLLSELYPGEYECVPSRNSFDYVYRVSDLATLKGKKYHSKKNHISFFEKNFDWKYEELTPDLLRECAEMNEEWYELNADKDSQSLQVEKSIFNMSIDLFDELELRGGLLRANGKIVAFTFGEKLNDNMFDTHFEKALSSVRGAYPMINMLFAKNTINDFEFVNREDDVGSEGLRKAKLSYHPEFMVEKFTAVKL